MEGQNTEILRCLSYVFLHKLFEIFVEVLDLCRVVD